MARGNMKRWIGAGAAFVIALAAVLWILHSGEKPPADAPAVAKKTSAREARAARRQIARTAQKGEKVGAKAAAPAAFDDSEPPGATAMTEEEVRAHEEEKLVGAFYDMTDKWLKPSKADVPMEAVEKFRERFNRIPQARKAECLQRALNLLPDENVMLLAGILLDKGQPAEYLELVYNDILNRDESVKKPLLKEIFKDREHPCWATTAWILDVTGEIPGK